MLLCSPSFNIVDFQSWSNVRSPAKQVNLWGKCARVYLYWKNAASFKVWIFPLTNIVSRDFSNDKYNLRGDFSSSIYEEFFSGSLSSRVSFKLQSVQRFTEFWGLFIQSLRLGQTQMSALLRKSLLLENSNHNNRSREFTKTAILLGLAGFEPIITNSA